MNGLENKNGTKRAALRVKTNQVGLNRGRRQSELKNTSPHMHGRRRALLNSHDLNRPHFSLSLRLKPNHRHNVPQIYGQPLSQSPRHRRDRRP
jgi:hypothetical protein